MKSTKAPHRGKSTFTGTLQNIPKILAPHKVPRTLTPSRALDVERGWGSAAKGVPVLVHTRVGKCSVPIADSGHAASRGAFLAWHTVACMQFAFETYFTCVRTCLQCMAGCRRGWCRDVSSHHQGQRRQEATARVLLLSRWCGEPMSDTVRHHTT